MVNGKRKVGELVARRIERMLGLPAECLDVDYPLPSELSPKVGRSASSSQSFSVVSASPPPPNLSRPAFAEEIRVRMDGEAAIVEELVEELIYVGVSFNHIRPRVSRMTAHGSDNFDFEVMIRPDLYLLGDVYMVRDNRKFEQQAISQIMAQAIRAKLSKNKYFCVTFGDPLAQPRLRTAIDEMLGFSFIDGHIHIQDVHSERDEIYKSVIHAMNN
jgi:hypothetical protein